MNPQYTYTNKHGIYYFRLILAGDSEFKGTEIRFSLRTRIPSEAKERAYTAWLTANSIDLGDYTDAKAIRAKIRTTTFLESTTRPDPVFHTPDLVVLSEHINRDDKDSIQNAITKVINVGGKIFVPYSPDGFIPNPKEDNRCSIFAIHDPEHGEAPTYPLEVEVVVDQHVVLSGEGAKAARFSEDNNFTVEEFYSYNHGNNWSARDGFSVRIIPAPFRVKLAEILITKKHAAALRFPDELQANSISSASKRKCGFIGEELDAYSNAKYKNNHWTERTKKDYDGVFKAFVEIIGDKPVEDITMDDISSYCGNLMHLPSNRRKNPVFSKLDARDAITLNIKRGGKIISHRTKQKYIERLHGPFEFFSKEKWIIYNYFTELIKPRLDIEEEIKVRHPFTAEDLKVMFEGKDSIRLLSAKTAHPSRPWGFLIALFTGARAEEIFSLLIDNVVLDGDPYFDIKINKGHNRLKTKSATRKIPVHPKLLELGFKEYVEMSRKVQKNKSPALLFPELTISKHHGWSRNTTRWFNQEYLTKLGIKTEKKVFHSFRHGIADKFKRAEQLTVFKANYYIGHKGKNDPEWVTVYGSDFKTEALQEITNLISFDINFSTFRKKCLDTIRIKHLKELANRS